MLKSQLLLFKKNKQKAFWLSLVSLKITTVFPLKCKQRSDALLKNLNGGILSGLHGCIK